LQTRNPKTEEGRRRAKKETSNIQHPTSNIQYLKGSRHRHWMFDVGCSMLRSSGFRISAFGLRISGLQNLIFPQLAGL
jgi:hypothetical protein